MTGRVALVAAVCCALAVAASGARAPRLDALRADAIALGAVQRSALAERPKVVHAQLGHIGSSLVWIVDVELSSHHSCGRPGVYSYCIPSFLPPVHMLLTVDDATGRVRQVAIRREVPEAPTP